MPKSLTVVVLVLLVLTGAMGLRNIATANAATVSGSSSAIWATGIGPAPMPPVTGKVPASAIGPAPMPPVTGKVPAENK